MATSQPRPALPLLPLSALLLLLLLSHTLRAAHASAASAWRPGRAIAHLHRLTPAVRHPGHGDENDAKCSTGPRSGPVCCGLDCPRCGGKGCGANGRGARCCTGRIRRSGRVCGRDERPCLVSNSDNNKPKPNPNPNPGASIADPTCATGVKRGNVCCPAACGRCGGAGCGGRSPGGGSCCIGTTRRAGVRCTAAGPPCLIARGAAPAPAPVPPPTVAPPTVAAPPSTVAPPQPPPPSSGGGSGPRGVSGRWVNIDAQLRGRPQARHEACFIMVNGKGYLLGGRGRKRIDVLDPAARRWTAGPAMPREMHHMQCVSVGADIYIVGAWEGGSPCERNLDQVYILNTATLTWRTAPGLPRARWRGSGGAVVIGRRIYLVAGNTGGHGANAGRCGDQAPGRTVGWFDYFDIDANRWVVNTLPDMMEPRDHVTAAVVRGELCVAGGRDGAQRSFFGATRGSSYCFNFGTNRWRRADDIPSERAGAAMGVTCDGRMVIVGGEGRFSPAFKATELFDGSRWTRGPDLVRERHGTGLAIARCPCGHIFIASGSGRRGGRPELDSTELYIPPGSPATCSQY